MSQCSARGGRRRHACQAKAAVCVSRTQQLEMSDAAPLLGEERRTAASSRKKRARRRGPRSLNALIIRQARRRRCEPKNSNSVFTRQSSCQRSSPENVGGESPTNLPFALHSQPLNILCINICSILSKLDQLCYVLRTLDIHLVAVQETWLDASTTEVDVPGYVVISRKDRSEPENRGGVLTLCSSQGRTPRQQKERAV